MAIAILRLEGVDDDVELSTTDPMTCRAVWRLLSGAVDPDEMIGLESDPTVSNSK
jgi:hypothetical protein